MLLLTAEAHDDAVMEVVLVGTTGLVAADAAAAQSGSESPPFQIPSQQTGRNRKSENIPPTLSFATLCLTDSRIPSAKCSPQDSTAPPQDMPKTSTRYPPKP